MNVEVIVIKKVIGEKSKERDDDEEEVGKKVDDLINIVYYFEFGLSCIYLCNNSSSFDENLINIACDFLIRAKNK